MNAVGALATRRFPLFILIAAWAVLLAAATGAQAGARDHGHAPSGERTSEDISGPTEDDSGRAEDEVPARGDDESDEELDASEPDSRETQSGEQRETPQLPRLETDDEEVHRVEQESDDEEGEPDRGGKEDENHKGREDDDDHADHKAQKGNPIPQGGPAPEAILPSPPGATVPDVPLEQKLEASRTRVKGRHQFDRKAWTGESVLASTKITLPVASKSLAGTGFGAWQVALLGAVCIAASALLLRRTRRT